MRETAGKWEMRKFRRNEYLCQSAGSIGGIPLFLLPAISFPGGSILFEIAYVVLLS